MRGFRELLKLDEAIKMLKRKVTHRIADCVYVSLQSANGRICGEDICTPWDHPPYDRSAVDGYAVIAEDTFGASPTNPIRLRLVAEVEAGMDPSRIPEVKRGEAVEVLTGAPIPCGSTAVIPFEEAERGNGEIEVHGEVYPGQNISKKGEDFKAGEVIIHRGELIRPWHIAVAATFGMRELKVLQEPRAALLSTGNELVEPGEELRPGQIYNSTKPMLASALRSLGCCVTDLGTSRDDPEDILTKIIEGVRGCDLVIVTGGTSVGTHDIVPEAISKISELVVHGLAIRPGKTAGFAVVDGKPVFMLSGFPVASLIQFWRLVIPAIEHMTGCRFEPAPKIRGRLARRVVSPPGIRSFIRVRVLEAADGEIVIEPLRLTGSGVLSTLISGNGLLVVPEEVEGYDEGEVVEVELFSPVIRLGDEA